MCIRDSYSALRRVRYEDALRDRFYEEERLRPEALRRIRYDEALREQEYACLLYTSPPRAWL